MRAASLPRSARRLAAVALGLLLCAGVGRARAQTAADSTVGGYLRTLSDSTDAWFGKSAAPVDTSGLDTLGGEVVLPRGLRFALSAYPTYVFNRADGSTPGATAHAGLPRGLGRVGGKIGWALASKQRRGGAEYTDEFSLGGRRGFALRLWAGRSTVPMNRERFGSWMPAVYGFLYGGDRSHYLRTDGFEGTLERETPWWRAGVGYRDRLESALWTSTTWNLSGHPLSLPGNLPAALGRARELSFAGALRLPVIPFRLELEHQTSGDALGSDFSYRRWRAATGGEITLGRAASIVPQAVYGRLSGGALPQEAFYLGQGVTLQSLHLDALGGTGLALGRLDVIGAQDLLELLRLPHSGALTLQPALFATTGAVWGADPYGGPARRGVDWPDRRLWLGEAGVAVHYNLGPLGTRVITGLAFPVGPAAGRNTELVVLVTRPLDVLRAPREVE